MTTRLPALLRAARSTQVFSRNLNSLSAAMTKIHRQTFERTYPTVVVLPDGSSINIQYHEPRKIIKLPLNVSTLSEAERKSRINKRKPKTKIRIEEDIEDDFDAGKYLKFIRK